MVWHGWWVCSSVIVKCRVGNMELKDEEKEKEREETEKEKQK